MANLFLIGVCHNDPFGAEKTQNALRLARENSFIPDCIAVEWRSDYAHRVILQRDTFGKLLAQPFKMRYGHDPATKEGHPYNKRICIHCGQEFWPNGPNTKTCSTQCSHEHNKQKMRDWRAEKKVQVGSEMVRTAT